MSVHQIWYAAIAGTELIWISLTETYMYTKKKNRWESLGIVTFGRDS